MNFIFASANEHKIKELRDKMPSFIHITGMREYGITDDIEENGTTLEENARIKAMAIHAMTGENVIADDSGLEIDALNGAPGVYSARYAGAGCTFADNNLKVLSGLKGMANRKANFRTVIHLILHGEHHEFEGRISGNITEKPSGKEGFGYDPIFVPEGHKQTFAEMDLKDKNRISHRAQAVEKLIAFLETERET